TARDPYSGVAGTTTLVVKPVVVTITSPSAPVVQGQVVHFSATATSSAGVVEAGSRLLWTSSDQAIALPSIGGFVTALHPGTVAITATDPLTGAQDTTMLTVTGLFPRVTAVTITPDGMSITPGDHQIFSASVTL